ncbi:unnamed protein product [Kuraishia capsulata CBS 1993]|uniref:RNA polymerase I-specific transcription initiation factor RRN6 n=1 Tax=Kuraishia capsulata CBS 1993 TaxID=1382522 RepID=W6MPR6_9ASCO|nr:uncharacterized protein KUCA_T00004693001 [Kuraishia capsulata CBS 1993]CDK28709.1 unnamed protein product [Kuraishia capsulata CBS 1993]
MWPSKKKVGPQLTYGIEGPGVYREAHDPNRYWSFANELDYPINFTLVQGSNQLLRKPLFATLSHGQRLTQIKEDWQRVQSEVFVPTGLGRKLEHEAKAYVEGVHDPVISDQLIIANVRVSRAIPLLVLGYVQNMRRLHFSLLMWRERAVLEVQTKDIRRMSVPWISKSVVVNMSSDILQISFEEPFDKQGGRNCLVLTRESLVLFRLTVAGMSKNNLILEVVKHAEWTPEEIGISELVYATASPFNSTEISVVNARGDFRIIEIQKKGTPFIPKKYSNCTIYDPLVLSKFKRVIWGASPNELLVFSRSRLYKYDTIAHGLTELVTAMAWSKILDLRRIPFMTEYFALLTDRELVIADFSDGVKKVLAFKHCLDDDDPSMTLSVSESPVPNALKDNISLEQMFVCTVTSKASRLVWNVTIGIEADNIVLLGQPFITPSFNKTMSGMVNYFYDVDESALFGKLRGYRENMTSASTGSFSIQSWRRRAVNTDAKVSRPISVADVSLGMCAFTLSANGDLVSSISTSDRQFKMLPESKRWFDFSEELKDTLLEELEEDENEDDAVPVEEGENSVSDQVYEKLKELFDFLVDIKSDDTLWEEDERDKIQELASDFTTSIAEMLNSKSQSNSSITLFEATENRSFLIDDLTEMDYMLKMLFENFKGENIDFETNKSLLKNFVSSITSSSPEILDLASLRSLLPRILSPDSLTPLEQSLVARDVGLSFTSFHLQTDTTRTKISRIQKKLAHRYQTILEKWGDPYTQQEETNVRLTQRLESQLIPTVISSQKRKHDGLKSQIRKTKFHKPSNLKNDSFFSMPSSVPQSQIESSLASTSSYESAPRPKKSKTDKKGSSKRKQKRRLGGFM